MIDYKILASGSKGNAVIIDKFIMIDCGVPFRTLNENYKDLKLLLLTHKHKDHFYIQTIKRLSTERPTLRIGCCEWLVQALVDTGINKRNIDVYEIGKIYDYGSFKVSPVKLYHYVPNCGYRLFLEGGKVLYATDTKHLSGIAAKDYDLYLLEANYTDDDISARMEEKEQTGAFSYEKRVINTHLSQKQCDDFIAENAGGRSLYVYLHQHKEGGSDV